MKKILIFVCVAISVFSMAACGRKEKKAADRTTTEKKEVMQMQIRIKADENTLVYKLNNSKAARDLYKQLPLTLDVENFGDNEKIFYPPEKLDLADTPLAKGGKGVLAYYEPWGDVVLFYGSFGQSESLYGLGDIISGDEYIESLSGEIEITAVK